MASGCEWLKARVAAERVGVNYRTFRYWCQHGKVVHIRLNGWGIRVPESEIQRLLSDRRGPAEEVARQLSF